jgi:hypothetical protein
VHFANMNGLDEEAQYFIDVTGARAFRLWNAVDTVSSIHLDKVFFIYART